MQIENNLTLVNSILNNGQCILFSADGIWGISCNALKPDVVSKLLMQADKAGSFIAEILVSDLDMLKNYTVDLHPRVETLLVYHERPVRIKCKINGAINSALNGHQSYFRMVKDKPSRVLINEIKFPIFTISFLEEDELTQVQLNGIKIDAFENIGFIASESEYSESNRCPLLRITFNDEGLIEVLN